MHLCLCKIKRACHRCAHICVTMTCIHIHVHSCLRKRITSTPGWVGVCSCVCLYIGMACTCTDTRSISVLQLATENASFYLPGLSAKLYGVWSPQQKEGEHGPPWHKALQWGPDWCLTSADTRKSQSKAKPSSQPAGSNDPAVDVLGNQRSPGLRSSRVKGDHRAREAETRQSHPRCLVLLDPPHPHTSTLAGQLPWRVVSAPGFQQDASAQ